MSYTDYTEFGDFWVRKVRNFHNRFDANRDGRISQADFDLIADRLITTAGLQGREADDTRKYFTNEIWKVYYNASGESASIDDFVDNLIATGKKEIVAMCFNLFNRFFKAIDTNRSGLISLKEFTRFLYIIGMSEELAQDSFAALDTNGDGVISRGEFIHGSAEYFTEEFEGNPSDVMFGPLP
jgi:Ca2+-binding EF-hand superfamily protein